MSHETNPLIEAHLSPRGLAWLGWGLGAGVGRALPLLPVSWDGSPPYSDTSGWLDAWLSGSILVPH